MSRLVFLSCHLSGTGHLIRTMHLARAALRHGHAVTVISGGRVLGHVDQDGLDVVQLDPVQIDGLDFATLRDGSGAPVSPALLAARAGQIAEVLSRVVPDALITELFPFGRRMLAEEFLAAIAAAGVANRQVRVLCSVRDIPEPKPKRLAECADRLARHYHGVLVHGDADVLALATTWPLPDDVTGMIHHVGYIGAPMPRPDGRGDEVLVSVGGGVLGRALLETAAKAALLGTRPWRLLVGGSDAADVAGAIMARFGSGALTAEPARPDYRALLAGAACSISLCGYNTAVELASCTTPVILVPSEEAGEQEQLIRAARLAEYQGIAMMRNHDLTPAMLASAAEALATGPVRPVLPLAIDDGSRAVQVIEAILAEAGP